MNACPLCDTQFEPVTTRQRFCSKSCASKTRYRKDPEKYRTRSLEYYNRNTESCKERSNKWHAENKAHAAEHQKLNRDVINARHRERWATDPEYRALRLAKYHARKWAFTEDFTYAMLLELRTQDCFYCGGPGGAVDHLVAKSKGGEDRLDNLVPTCIPCNSKKQDSDLAIFYARYPAGSLYA